MKSFEFIEVVLVQGESPSQFACKHQLQLDIVHLGVGDCLDGGFFCSESTVPQVHSVQLLYF